jgi:hypothetical protein
MRKNYINNSVNYATIGVTSVKMFELNKYLRRPQCFQKTFVICLGPLPIKL